MNRIGTLQNPMDHIQALGTELLNRAKKDDWKLANSVVTLSVMKKARNSFGIDEMHRLNMYGVSATFSISTG